MPDFPPTAEQQAAIDEFLTGRSLVIEAGAGTGKTSTLVKLAAAAPQRRGQYVAFNRRIVDESREKMPANVTANTAHSLAWRAIVGPSRDLQARLRSSSRMKSRDIAARLGIDPLGVTTQDHEYKRLGAGYLAGLVLRTVTEFCQSADPEPTVAHVPYINGIDIPPGAGDNNALVAAHIIGYVRAAWADLQRERGSLPFKPEHYLKMWQLSKPTIAADFILFDEAQDASPVMLDVILRQKCQLVFVGDSQQAIYEFTGAVNALAQISVETRTFLTQSFRFGPAVASVANRVLAALNADLSITGTASINSTVGPVDDPDVLLCRKNATALGELLRAMKDGKRAFIVGRVAEDLLKFARAAQSLMADGWTSHPDLACFGSWGEVREYVEQDEQGADLQLLVELIDETGVEKIIEALGAMGTATNADIVISTAHQSKGLEWANVRLAGDFADEPDEAELRLLYVAVTRARVRLDITQVGCLETLAPARADLARLLNIPADDPELAEWTPKAGAALLAAEVAAETIEVAPADSAAETVIARVLARYTADANDTVLARAGVLTGELVEALRDAGIVADTREGVSA